MKKILYTLLSAGVLLLANMFVANGTFQVAVESPTPLALAHVDAPAGNGTSAGGRSDPGLRGDLRAGRSVRGVLFHCHSTQTVLPACHASARCGRGNLSSHAPARFVRGRLDRMSLPEEVPTPFNMKYVLAMDMDSGSLTWSPDGRYGMLIIHPPDDFTEGWTAEEWEQFKTSKLEDLNISASSLYVFDAGTDTWRELYRADRKFFYAAHWSPDGEWIAFVVSSSMISVHPFQAEDGVYVIHPDGSGLQRLGGLNDYGTILGWIGDNILLRRSASPRLDRGFHACRRKVEFRWAGDDPVRILPPGELRAGAGWRFPACGGQHDAVTAAVRSGRWTCWRWMGA